MRQLGPRGELAGEVLGALLEALPLTRDRRVADCQRRWASSVGRASGLERQDGKLTAGLGSLRRRLQGAPGQAAGARGLDLLLVVQTYYALVVKLVAALAATRAAGGAGTGIGGPGGLPGALGRLERGRPFSAAGVEGLLEVDDCFGWYLWAGTPRLEAALGAVRRRVEGLGLPAGGDSAAPADLLKPLYQALLPGSLRHRLGEHYTPDWLAERLLRQTLGQDLGRPGVRVLDPACGSGTFLLLLLRHLLRRTRGTPEQQLAGVLDSFVGLDIHPLATLAARANLLLALGPLLPGAGGKLRLPVLRADALLGQPGAVGRPFDYVVGNPPWVNWEHLPEDYRQQTLPLWRRYGLFPHRGFDAILGKGKKDLSMLMTCVALDRHLLPGGRLGFVLPRGLLRSAGAGEGFRAFCLPDGTPFAPLSVEDLDAARPFAGAATRPVTVIFARGQRVRYPVPYGRWPGPPDEGQPPRPGLSRWQAEPVDPRRPLSPWICGSAGALKALRKLRGRSPAAYQAHEGANTGGANGVYWLEPLPDGEPAAPGLLQVKNVTRGARRIVPAVRAALEPELVYPLLRGRDVGRFLAEPSLLLLMVQDPRTRRGLAPELMRRRYPAALAYLSQFEQQLLSRPALRRYFRAGDPWWSMFNVGRYTFARWKVVWREQSARLAAAVAAPMGGRPVLPDHKLMQVEAASAAEAHYLCAVLNSAPARLLVASYGEPIQLSTHILSHLAVPAYDAGSRLHLRLAALSRMAHCATRRQDAGALAALERGLERAAPDLWGLGPRQARAVADALAELDRPRG